MHVFVLAVACFVAVIVHALFFFSCFLGVAAKGWASTEKGRQGQAHYVHDPVLTEGHRPAWKEHGQVPGEFGPWNDLPVTSPAVAWTQLYTNAAKTVCSNGHGCRMVF